MSLSKERLELRKKLEGKLEDNTSIPPKKEVKNVSRLVIPQKFLFTNLNKSEDQPKSLNASLSKSTGNLISLNSSKKLSTSSFNSNGLQIEAARVPTRSLAERKLSSKSFSVILQSSSDNILYDDVKSQQKLITTIDNDSLYSSTPKNTPVIVGSIRKNSLPEDTSTQDELLNTINLVRSPKPAKKEETSTVLHFNFASKPDAFTKEEVSPSLRKIPNLLRSGSRCAIRVPNEVWEDTEKQTEMLETSEDIKNQTEMLETSEDIKNQTEMLLETSEDIKNISVDDVKKSDVEEDEEEMYVNIDIIRRYYDCSARIKYGPIKKLPVPSIRYSLIRPFPTLV